MGPLLSLSVLEIIVLMVGAITLGFTIHFFVVSRRSLNQSMLEASGQPQRELESWKLRYFNEVEQRDAELHRLRDKLAELEESNELNAIEADENRKLNKQLKAEIAQLKAEAEKQQQALVKDPVPLMKVAASTVSAVRTDYTEQLRNAQLSLTEQNDKINRLLEQISQSQDNEVATEELKQQNEDLKEKNAELRRQLSARDKEMQAVRQKQQLSTEMTSRLDSAYSEFHILQDKIQKLESQVAAAKRNNMEFEDVKESYQRVNLDYEELKRKYNAVNNENKQLLEELTITEDKLKEATTAKLQLQKKIMYLEELNTDLELVADANKKLESQLKRIGELESMLNMVQDERDLLAGRRHTKAG